MDYQEGQGEATRRVCTDTEGSTGVGVPEAPGSPEGGLGAAEDHQPQGA